MIRVLFLCLGNICRSPMGEAVFRHLVQQEGLEREISVDSAGTGGWHAGERPHKGTLEILTRYQIPHDWMRARQLTKRDLSEFDYIVAMDADNLKNLQRLGTLKPGQAFRLLDLVSDHPDGNVPDPWYTGDFDETYDLVTRGCLALLEKIRKERL
ncbi:low molecular weight protein-tyrosine-phosphatase [Tumebacillus flagellatus]|uniref:protein-tyrosine-phosphatase n=1 Tax=Tumebacillus flagellatus TaxID=1157490 RepID=A0A074LSL5_9BACL|nr:low molecular weight protein-tyrosine-phosphatase [Tumebacillus flagellatus]KEO82793.1 protein tyrosine phosphatase [Tumebacillus flagellatus]